MCWLSSFSFCHNWQIWLLAMFVLLIAEIFTSGFLLGCFSVGALASSLCAALGLGIVWQILFFCVFSLLSFIYLRPFINGITKKKDTKTGMDALIGREVFVHEDIISLDGRGYVKCDGDLWRAVSSDMSDIKKGTKVRIVSFEGLVLKVEKIN